MGFLGNIFGGAFKVALTPIALVDDVFSGEDKAAQLIDGAIEDMDDAVSDLSGGEFL
jgi:hypothetical protein